MSFTAQRLYELLPAIHRIRDAEQGEPLRQLIEVIAEQVAVLEEDLAQLYDDQFIETCADWVTPYIGGLIGYRSLHGRAPRISSPRADVANTIAYRRRKGTATMLEQLARDVTGWDARVVEFFELLIATQYMNHLRPDCLGTPDIRKWEPLERLGTAFNSIAHTVDVRRIETKKGKFNIPNIGVFLWRLSAYSLTGSPAFPVDSNRFLLSPLETNMPLFTRPEPEETITHLAEPINVPIPISRRVLDAHTSDYYGPGLSLQLRIADEQGSLQAIAVEEIHVCNLSDDGPGWAHEGQLQIAVDPVLGRLWFPSTVRRLVHIVGHRGGSYRLSVDGAETDPLPSHAGIAEVQAALGALPGVSPGNISVIGRVVPGAIRLVIGFAAALGDHPPFAVHEGGLTPAATVSVSDLPRGGGDGLDLRVDCHYGFGAAIGGGEYERAKSFASEAEDAINIEMGDSIQAALNLVAQGGVVEIRDSGRYEESLELNLSPNARVEFRAGNGHRPLVALSQPFALRGAADSELYINGLVFTGDALVIPAENNEVTRVTLRHCTLVPGLQLNIDGTPMHPTQPSLIVTNPNVTVVLEHCIVGAIHTTPTTKMTISDSIVDATDPTFMAFTSVTDPENEAGGELTVNGSTVIGPVRATSMPLISNTIVHAGGEVPVRSVRKQSGCVRFSYVPPGSVTPRRFRCQPDLAIQAAIEEREKQQGGGLTDAQRETISHGVSLRIRPTFTSLRYGRPAYCQLRQATPEIHTGADDESEMGVFHQVYQSQRETNLRTRFDEYLRFGLEAGVFYET